jgi:hypothetical protein
MSVLAAAAQQQQARHKQDVSASYPDTGEGRTTALLTPGSAGKDRQHGS